MRRPGTTAQTNPSNPKGVRSGSGRMAPEDVVVAFLVLMELADESVAAVSDLDFRKRTENREKYIFAMIQSLSSVKSKN